MLATTQRKRKWVVLIGWLRVFFRNEANGAILLLEVG
jgi:hypothetical protein